MSEMYGTTGQSGTDEPSPDSAGKVDAAKQEATDLAGTAATQAKDVLGTAKDEASTVVSEAKMQAKDLFAQTQHQLKDQAHTQQQRLASGLTAVGDELGTMAANSEGAGVTGDLVQQLSTRLSAAGAWLNDRDPSSVLDEVKSFARRRPGMFILAAAVAGIAAGRLTRALAANAKDDAGSDTASFTAPVAPAVPQPALTQGDTWAPVDDAPIYAEAAPVGMDLPEDGDDRRYAV